jgi:SAM-dependent MidA family methyltransferase
VEQQVAQATDEPTRIRRASEARRLLMPEEMGESFKAIALGRQWQMPLAGFSLRDLLHRL